MESWLERVKNEREELDVKKQKLFNFIQTEEKFYELSEENRFLLRLQWRIMSIYSDILLRRVSINE